MSTEPENLVLQMLRDMRGKMDTMATRMDGMATKDDVVELGRELRSEIQSLRADVASDILHVNAKVDGMRRDVSDQIVGLRRTMVDYHTTVIGHASLITDLEARMRRVEQHLGLPSLDH